MRLLLQQQDPIFRLGAFSVESQGVFAKPVNVLGHVLAFHFGRLARDAADLIEKRDVRPATEPEVRQAATGPVEDRLSSMWLAFAESGRKIASCIKYR